MALALLAGLFSLTMTAGAVTTNLTNGSSVPLDYLTAGNSAQVGDKLFSDFTFNMSGAFPVTFGADDITVTNITDGSGNFGIRLQGNISPNVGGSGDIFVTFTVLVLAPNTFISDIHLAYSGTAISAVTEQALVGSTVVGHLEVSNPGGASDVMANIAPAQVQLLIQKDIFVRSVSEPASINYIDQTFSQVPEPGTMMLVSVGLLGLCAVARRSSKIST